MGLESNVGGDCDLKFTTTNNFKLLHTVNNGDLGNYTIRYAGLEFDDNSDSLFQLPCTTTPTNIDFRMNGLTGAGIDGFIDAGVYQDIVHVEVTTQ